MMEEHREEIGDDRLIKDVVALRTDVVVKGPEDENDNAPPALPRIAAEIQKAPWRTLFRRSRRLAAFRDPFIVVLLAVL
jgi:hypothetical protein